MSTEKEKWLKFHDGQYQFKIPFMLYADFESVLKPVDKRYRKKVNTVKTERKRKASYTEKINTHVPSVCCVHYLCLWRCLRPLKNVSRWGLCGKVCRIHRRRGCMKHFHGSPWQSLPMSRKENTRQQKSVTFASKSLMTQEIERWEITAATPVYIE